MFSTLSVMVLISMMGAVELISVTAPQKTVNVTNGESVLIPCIFTTTADTKSLIIQWNFVGKHSLNPEQVYWYQSGQAVVGKGYEGRLHPPINPNTTHIVSIRIDNMQLSDAGVYTCEVHNFPDVEGKSEANIIVNVLEKPSVPYCAIHGDVESGHRVTLKCHSESGSPTPTYTWIRLDQKKTMMPVTGVTTTTGILQFTNISQFQFGEYQCNASNVAGSNVCSVELTPDADDGLITGAVIGALLGCALIILVVWFIAHRMKKQKYRAVKEQEASEMKGSTHQAQPTSDGVPMATVARPQHAEEEEAQA